MVCLFIYTMPSTGALPPAAPDANHCLQESEDAIDIVPLVITEVQCR